MIPIATKKKPADGPKNRPKKKGVGGRPGLYKEWLKEEKLILLQGWARDGLKEKDIAAKIGIRDTTFCDWKAKYPEFNEALKKGREVCDYEVENALHKRAIGYYVKVMKPIKLKEEKQKVSQ